MASPSGSDVVKVKVMVASGTMGSGEVEMSSITGEPELVMITKVSRS